MKLNSSFYLHLFLLIVLIENIGALYLRDGSDEMEENKKLPLRWKGNEELPIELEDADVDFSNATEFQCILGPLCQIQIRSLLDVAELPPYSQIEIVALYNGLGLAVSKTNTSLAGIPLTHGIKKFILKFTTNGTFVRVPFVVSVPKRSLPEVTHQYSLSLDKPKRLSCQKTPEICVDLTYAISYATNISIANLSFSAVREKIRGGSYIEFADHSYPLDVCQYAKLHEIKKRIISNKGLHQATKEFKSKLGEKYIIESIWFSTDLPCYNFELNDPNPLPKEDIKFDVVIDLGTIILDP
ncbi:unnamed protein product [Caenorhabditis brenneri]